VVGGITDDTPWADELGVSRSYLESQTVLAVAPQASDPDGLKGERVAVRLGDPAGAMLRSRGARVEEVDSVAPGQAPVAVEDWRVPALGLRPTQTVLKHERHIVLAPPGENGWVLTIDRFLAGREGQVRAALAAAATP
jgi:polar amino acid transport system substrate-binding protein